jgi:hypothetical protein
MFVINKTYIGLFFNISNFGENPLKASTLFRYKAAGFCDVAEVPAGMAESGAFIPEWD